MTKELSDLTRLTSLTPQVALRIDELCKAVYKNATGLSAREKEIAALVTSSLARLVSVYTPLVQTVQASRK